MILTFEPSISHLRRAMNRHGSQLSIRPHGPDEVVGYSKPQTPDVVTPQRARWRTLMQENAAAWRGLFDEQRSRWATYANANQKQLEMLRKKPSVEPFTGYRLFTMLYCQRCKLGMEPLLEPPRLAPQTEVVELDLERVQEDGTVEVKAHHQHAVLEVDEQPTHVVQVAMTPPTRRRGRRPQRKHVVLVQSEYGQGFMNLAASGNTMQLRSACQPPAPGRRFGVLARVIRREDGMPGPWTWFDTSKVPA